MKILTKLLIWMFLFVLFIEPALAVEVDIEPIELYFKDVLRSGYSEKIVTITTDSDDDLIWDVYSAGAIKDWVEFSQESGSFNKSFPLLLRVAVNPSPAINLGEYSGYLIFDFQVTNQLTSAQPIAASLKTTVQVTNKEIRQARVSKIIVEDFYEGEPIEIYFEIINEGNVPLNPNLYFNILDIDKSVALELMSLEGETMLPSTKTAYKPSFTNELRIGQYWLDAKILVDGELLSEQLLFFDVLEEGQPKKKIYFEDLMVSSLVIKGSPAKLTAYIKNIGDVRVNAQLKGDLYFNDSFVGKFETDAILIKQGEQKEIETYLILDEEGLYTASAYIAYDGKITDTKDAVIKISQKKEIAPPVPLEAGVLILFLAPFIAIIFYFILKKSLSRKR